MIDTGKLHVQAGAGASAFAELGQVSGAFDTLEKTYIEAMIEGTHEGQAIRITAEDREKLFQAIHNLRKVRRHLELVISDGKLARFEIEQLAKAEQQTGAAL